jgi:hypothetical protein
VKLTKVFLLSALAFIAAEFAYSLGYDKGECDMVDYYELKNEIDHRVHSMA